MRSTYSFKLIRSPPECEVQKRCSSAILGRSTTSAWIPRVKHSLNSSYNVLSPKEMLVNMSTHFRKRLCDHAQIVWLLQSFTSDIQIIQDAFTHATHIQLDFVVRLNKVEGCSHGRNSKARNSRWPSTLKCFIHRCSPDKNLQNDANSTFVTSSGSLIHTATACVVFTFFEFSLSHNLDPKNVKRKHKSLTQNLNQFGSKCKNHKQTINT